MRCIAVTQYHAPLETIVRDDPTPVGVEAVVRVTACGLCHSDLHIMDGGFDLGGGRRLDLPQQLLPLVLGHEPEGVVEALGPDAAARNPGVKIGDRVAVYPWMGCGVCAACRRGDQHICVGDNKSLGVRIAGGFSERLHVPDAAALIPAGTLAPGVAGVAMCSGLTAFAAIDRVLAGARGEPLLLIGLGGLGLMGVAIARARHDGPIIGVDIDPAKRALALERGATEVIDSADAGAVGAFVARTGGAGAVIDFVGATASFEAAMGAVRRGGHIVVVGLYGGAATLPLPMLPLRSVTISGSYVGTLDQARALIAMLQSGQVTPPPMTMKPLFTGANEALAALRGGQVYGRMVLQP